MTDSTDLLQISGEISDDAFWAVRGKAIQAYAEVEQSLSRIFASLTGMPMDVAGIIFFKIVSAGTLYEILAKLMRKKHGVTYSLFWNSFIKRLRNEVSETRNRIVHWNAVIFIGDKGAEVGLTPANLSDYGPNTQPPITTTNLLAFIEKCNFFARLGNIFNLFLTPHMLTMMDAGQQQAWRDIFLQPVDYPPPQSHPLSPKPPAPENPLPPSPA